MACPKLTSGKTGRKLASGPALSVSAHYRRLDQRFLAAAMPW